MLLRNISFLILGVCIWIGADAQTFKFKHFGESDGINTRFTYSIDQDFNGFLLVGTDEGLYQFDGFRFSVYYTEDGLAENFIRCSFKDSHGNLWFGHERGGVTKYDGVKFESIDLDGYTSSRINAICESENGEIWVITQTDGLVKVNADLSVEPFFEGIEEFMLHSAYVQDKENILLGTDMGLITCKISNSGKCETDYTDIIETKVNSITRFSEGELIIGTDDSGIYQVKTGDGLILRSLDVPEHEEHEWSINDIDMGPQGNIWVSTNTSGLFQLNYKGGIVTRVTDYGIGNMLGAKSIKRTFVDREGNLWIGTNGNGLVKLVDDYFAFYQFSEANQNNVQSVFVDDEMIWMGRSGGLTVTTRNPEELIGEYGVEEGLADTLFVSVAKDNQGTIWAASKGMGLYFKPSDSDTFEKFGLPDDKLSNRVNHLLVSGSILWAATDFGIYQIKDNEIKSHITMRAGLPHNVVKAMFKDIDGRVWIATHSSEITYIDEFIQTANPPIKENLVDATCFAQDRNGEVWVGTNGTGVFKITGSDTTIFRKNDGLHSDYCYSLICDAQNRIWVGHRGGMSRIDVENTKVEAFYPSSSSKPDFSPNAACRDSEGLLWFGTNSGLLRYNLEKDVPNVIEPALNLTHVNVSDSLHGIVEHIELPYGTYKIRFDFVGISFKKPENVAYKYILEGHDLGWSELKEQNFASYNRLDPGDYTFNVTSFNADGYGGRDIRTIKVSVDYPFWEKWWFYVSVAFSVFMLIRMVVRRRERIMRENQDYLQHELNQRTREVVEQKELLEIKNKDITDSIVYAKNIQKAMLPAPDSLGHVFTDSFVFFKPRDIVSGDFYWVQNYENKIIVACADCTGHGVPGAFMSLIGNVLLKEVARNETVNSPDQVLGMLDQELRSLLNKKGSEFGVQDGMDISVVEFDTDTYMMRGASAKRPIVIYKDGERFDIKGDRFAVGGTQETNSKIFTLHQMQLGKGDVVYQFSDGYADQFGGALGKKLKMKRMMGMLDDLFHLDMEHQSRIVKQKFHEWKGHLPQVDDVILVGIKL